MDKLLELEKAYFNLGKTVFKFNNEDISSNIELNDDIHYEISKHLGKTGGLLNKTLRKKWLKRGICVDYDYVVDKKVPPHLIKYISKLRIYQHFPDKTEILRFVKLREVCVPFSNSMDSTNLKFVEFLKGIDHVILGEDCSLKLINKLDHDKVSVHTDSDSKIIKYQDYKDMKSKYIDISILKILETGGPFDNLPEAEYPILFSDICSVYLFLSKGIKISTPKIKFIIVIDDDIHNIDYYLNVIKPLYDELGIETMLDIFGRSIGYAPISGSRINLYFGLIYTKINLNTLISDDIEHYIYKNS